MRPRPAAEVVVTARALANRGVVIDADPAGAGDLFGRCPGPGVTAAVLVARRQNARMGEWP